MSLQVKSMAFATLFLFPLDGPYPIPTAASPILAIGTGRQTARALGKGLLTPRI